MFFLMYALKEACSSLIVHRFRFFSIGFGVFWAFLILIFFLAVGNGLHDGVRRSFDRYGKSSVFVSSFPAIPFQVVSQLESKVSQIQRVSHVLYAQSCLVQAPSQVGHFHLLGIDYFYASMANLALQEGRFFSSLDLDRVANVCVLGSKAKRRLFGASSATGKHIFVHGLGLLVLGVLDDMDNHAYQEQENILVPLTYLSKRKNLFSSCFNIRLESVPMANATLLEGQLGSYLGRHTEVDVKKSLHIFSLMEHARRFCTFFNHFEKGCWLIGCCFLLMGIIGMANMMLVAVQDRVPEIAIRRLLGATSREIIAMVVWEILIVTILSGLLGCIVGLGLVHWLNIQLVAHLKAYYVEAFFVPLKVCGLSLASMVVVSFWSALLPVYRALHIRPVQGLLVG